MIEFIDVHYSYYGTIEALRGIDLRIREGEIVAIMGENGAGKTTLLKHMNGLLRPTSGKVLVDGTDTRRATVAELSRVVGLVLQSADSMFFLETVYDEVAFSLRNFKYQPKEIESRVEAVLKTFNLDGYRNRSPFTLSGGEKKRLAIAIVLAWDPKYVVIDEPTIGQDVISKRKMIEIIRELSSRGKTVVVSSHDVEFVADLNPRVVLLSKGMIIADGRAEDVLTDEGLISKASLVMPQVPRALKELNGINSKILDVERAVEEILRSIVRGVSQG